MTGTRTTTALTTYGQLDRRGLVQRGIALGAGLATGGPLVSRGWAQDTATPPGTASGTTAAIVDAATVFLATLSEDQQGAVLFDWSDTAQKQRWSNFPTGLFDRDGIMWANLADDARTAWLALMEAAMSPDGYVRVLAEWEADQVLADEEGSGQGGGPGGMMYGTDYYWVALIGEPSDTEPWQIQFGGHHIAVNITVQGEQIAYTPAFIGVQWATYTDESGATIRPLGDMEDDAFALVNALNATQQGQAIIGSAYTQLTLGPGTDGDGQVLETAGIAGADLTSEQRTIFLQLIGHYTGMGLEAVASTRFATVEADLDATWFAWSGPTTQGEPVSFRIVGPTVNIEYAPQEMGGDPANHIHAISRDPSNDYGSSFTGLAIGQ